MQCFINQPLGLGDILWVQGVVDHFIDSGYDVVYPVGDVYYNMLTEYIDKPGLSWYHEHDDYPMKQVFSITTPLKNETQVYLPLQYADRHVSGPLLLTKYLFAEVDIPVDYRDHFNIKRDHDREQILIDTYGLHDEYILINECFATKPSTLKRNIVVDTHLPVHRMSIEQDEANGFHVFDWIGALQKAKAVHTVQTSICLLMDKYCDNDIHVYERRVEGWPRTFHNEIENVYKNPRWVYED
jgi:hypothetical protein